MSFIFSMNQVQWITMHIIEYPKNVKKHCIPYKHYINYTRTYTNNNYTNIQIIINLHIVTSREFHGNVKNCTI